MINSTSPNLLTTPSSPPAGQYQQESSAQTQVDSQDTLRQVLLRHHIGQEIAKNEEHAILTSVTIHDLQTQQYLVRHNDATTQHWGASLNKLPVALLVLEELRAGNVSLDTSLSWQASDRRAGAGVFDQADSPLSAPLSDVLYDMLNHSGNTAVRILVNEVLASASAVNARLQQKPQLVYTRLIPLDQTRFFLGYTTGYEALWTLEQVLAEQDAFGAFVKNALATNIFTDYGVQQVPRSDYVVLANKVGQLNDPDGDNRHDVGLIYNTQTGKTYGYAFLTTSPHDTPYALSQALRSLTDMGRTTLDYAGNHTANGQGNMAPMGAANGNGPVDSRMVY